MNSLLVGILLGSLGVLLTQTLLTWVLGRLGLLRREDKALEALEAKMTNLIDSRILKLVEETNKSLASLQNQITSNPYFEADGGGKPAMGGAPGTVRSDALTREALKDYPMSRGAGGV